MCVSRRVVLRVFVWICAAVGMGRWLSLGHHTKTQTHTHTQSIHQISKWWRRRYGAAMWSLQMVAATKKRIFMIWCVYYKVKSSMSEYFNKLRNFVFFKNVKVSLYEINHALLYIEKCRERERVRWFNKDKCFSLMMWVFRI